MRHWRLAVLIVLAVGLAPGCNLMSLPYFLLSGEAKEAPKWPLKPKEKGQEVRVAILGYTGVDVRPEFIRVDRDLCELLAQQLKRSFKDNDEKVTIVPNSQVEAYKDRHPDWTHLNLADIGEQLGADYVIYLEIGALTLYEQGSGNLLYHGRTDLTVSLVDVHDPSGSPERDDPSYQYPVSRGGFVPADEMTSRKFRLDFLTYVAKHLSWKFTAHPMDDEIMSE
jgi:hypothetical protein